MPKMSVDLYTSEIDFDHRPHISQYGLRMLHVERVRKNILSWTEPWGTIS